MEICSSWFFAVLVLLCCRWCTAENSSDAWFSTSINTADDFTPLYHALHPRFLISCVSPFSPPVSNAVNVAVWAGLSHTWRDECASVCCAVTRNILKCSHRSRAPLSPQTLQLCAADPSFWQTQLLSDSVTKHKLNPASGERTGGSNTCAHTTIWYSDFIAQWRRGSVRNVIVLITCTHAEAYDPSFTSESDNGHYIHSVSVQTTHGRIRLENNGKQLG